MLVFSVNIPFLISRVHPVHSFFEKKSILENTSQIVTNLFMPTLFRKIITTILIFIAIFADNRYHCMYYEYNPESIDDILKVMAANAKKRRLEKGWTRKYLCERSDVPVSTIAKFESLHTISLASYVAIAKALGYSSDVKKLMSEAIFTTMKELDTINNNKNRKRGQRENHK